MKSRLILSAFFDLRNVTLLAAALGAWYAVIKQLTAYPDTIGTLACITVYLIFVIQSLSSGKFREQFNKRQKIGHMRELNYTCLRLASEAKRQVNTAYLQKLKKVMEDKNEIANSYFRGEYSYLKEKIVEQTLNLVVSYLKLLTNFCIRSRELGGMDVSDIANRINMNHRKLGFTKDVNAAEDIKRVIEMDEKIINRLKDEKKELERISAKLDYMESTVNMFKHQILSSIESEEMLEKLETVVNEATALDNVIEDRRKNRISR